MELVGERQLRAEGKLLIEVSVEATEYGVCRRQNGKKDCE
jgi:hypothetical protein